MGSELFDFAFFPKYDESIKYLAENLADKEEWEFSAKQTKSFTILKNYLEHTYRKLKQEKKIVYTLDNKHCCFNTGLVTSNLEDIFAYFEEYKVKTANHNTPFFFKGFLKKSDNVILKLFSSNFPDVANYFESPDQLIFNPKCDLISDIDHIINDNSIRFPDPLTNEAELRRQLNGAIDDVKKKIRTNYTIAIPQFFNGKIQLLLPLCLTAGSPNADLALAVEKLNNSTYIAKTCLTIQMAYNNARLIVKPHSNWLKP